MKFSSWVSLKSLTVVSVVAGILYSTWPLGYWLNPAVSRNSLASGLEGVGQPYNWVFIGGDISSSLIVIFVCLFLWQEIKNSKFEKYGKMSLICMMIFGIGTIVDASLPLKCIQGLQICASFRTDYLLLAHGIFSIAASVFLFIGLMILWFIAKRNIILDTLLSGYVIFGIISLVQAITPGKNGNWSQDYYITLCSVWIALIPFTIYRVIERK